MFSRSLRAVFAHSVASYHDMSDIEQLVNGARDGDPMAQSLLYKQCRGRVVAVCQRVVGNRQLAEELADDAMLVAFSKLDQLQDAARFEAWVGQIARRLAIRHLRRHRQPLLVPLDEVAEMPDAEAPEISEAEIMQAVAALPTGYREVFRLSVLEGRSHQEIADRLGIAPHSSSSQLTRAKRLLRTMLHFGWVLLFLPLAWLLLRHPEEVPPQMAQAPVADSLPSEPAPVPIAPRRPSIRSVDSAATVQVEIVSPPAEPLPRDTVSIQQHVWDSLRPMSEPTWNVDVRSGSRWSFTVAYAQPMTGGFDLIQPYSLPLSNGTSIDNWIDFVSSTISMDPTPEEIVLGKIAAANIGCNAGAILRAESHRPPFEVRGQLSLRIGDDWTVGTGMGLMSLGSHFRIGEGPNRIEQTQTLIYLGLPAEVGWRLCQRGSLSVCASVGATLHLPLQAFLATDYVVDQRVAFRKRTALRSAAMFSAGVGLSLQWHLSPTLSLYVEPSLRYYWLPAPMPSTYLDSHCFAPAIPCGFRIVF